MASDSEFNEAGTFDEYNSHPYQGGYDIELTFGKPLPATPDICYPLSSAPASTPARVPAVPPKLTLQDPPPPPPQKPKPQPEQLVPSPPSLPLSQPPPSLPDGVASGPALPSPAEPWPYADPDGNWYVGARWWSPRCSNSCCGVGRMCQDSLWQRNAADYLFGYLPTWGPKRAETHTYANLNYAYERHLRQQAVSMVVEPEAIDAVFSDSWLSSDDFLPEEEPHSKELMEWTHAYEWHSSEKPTSIEVQPYHLYSDTSFNPDYAKEAYPQNVYPYALEWHRNKGNIGVNEEPSLPGFQYAYNNHTFQNPISVELKAYQNCEALCYNETYQEPSSQQTLHPYALEWHNTERTTDSEIKTSLPIECIYGNSYQEELYYQYSDGCYAHETLGSERSVSVEVQPVLSQAIYHRMHQEENYPGLDDAHVYERHIHDDYSSHYADPAEKLWAQLVNGQ